MQITGNLTLGAGLGNLVGAAGRDPVHEVKQLLQREDEEQKSVAASAERRQVSQA